MKLNDSQIQELYGFTRKHFVVYYDLQTELVDHLANDIEAMWQQNPKLSFEDAKNKAFKKFGIFGFMEPIEQKQKAMSKRYMRYLWSELKKWFELPQLLTTLALFILFYLAFSSSHIAYFAIAFYAIISVWCIYKTINLNRQFRRRKENSDKKWMLEEMIYKQAGGTALIFMSQMFNVFHISDAYASNLYVVIGLSVGFTALVLINYISFEIIPNKAEKLLQETYPEFCL